MSRPLIGVTCGLSTERCSDLAKYPFHHVYAWYSEAIWRAGGRPVIIPPMIGSDAEEEALDLVQRLDGIFFSGGGISTSPKADVQPKMMSTQPIRSVAEWALVRSSKALKLPIIGSCRGNQMICESLGGTLSDDVVAGHSQKHSFYYPCHPIEIVKNSKLASIVGAETWMVNSMHCQYIDKCPEGFIANAYSPENTIEGIESTDPDWFCVTFQYHPEVMIFDERARKMMAAFVDAARTYSEKKSK